MHIKLLFKHSGHVSPWGPTRKFWLHMKISDMSFPTTLFNILGVRTLAKIQGALVTMFKNAPTVICSQEKWTRLSDCHLRIPHLQKSRFCTHGLKLLTMMDKIRKLPQKCKPNVAILAQICPFWKGIWESTLVKSLRSPSVVVSVTTLALNQVIWRYTWECTQERSPSVVHNVITLALGQVSWRYTWVCILVKSLTVVHNVITLALGQVAWRYTWECILVKSLSVVPNVTTLALSQMIWRYTWECTLVKSLTVVPNVTTPLSHQVVWTGIWECILVKSLTVVLSVISLVPHQVVWTGIWECTLVKSLSAVLSVISLVPHQVGWRNIQECTLEKSPHQCTQCDYSSAYSGDLKKHMRVH